MDDLAEEMRRLSAAGMSFWAVPITDRSGRQLVYGRSPEGFVIEFVQPSEHA